LNANSDFDNPSLGPIYTRLVLTIRDLLRFLVEGN
jgi:hypothetical protein